MKDSRIANLSLVCSILVVMIHITCGYPANASWTVKVWLNFMHDGLCRVAVPTFFLISGFMLARHYDENGWWMTAVRKRIRSLVVPFLVWNSLYVCFLSFVQGTCGTKSPSWWITSIVLSCRAPMLGLLWYVRGLFFIVLVSPLMFFFFRKRWIARVFLGILFLVYVIVSPFEHHAAGIRRMFWYGFPLVGLFYFALGGYLRKWPIKIEVSTSLVCGSFISLIVLLLVRTRLVMGYGMCAANYLQVLIIPVGMFVIWKMIPNKAWPEWLTTSSFPIYLIHMFVIVGIRRIMIDYGEVWNSSLLWQIGLSSIVVLVSVALTLLLRVCAPTISKVMFGGR